MFTFFYGNREAKFRKNLKSFFSDAEIFLITVASRILAATVNDDAALDDFARLIIVMIRINGAHNGAGRRRVADHATMLC